MNSPLAKTAHTLTSKRGSWLVLGGIVVLVALIFGLLSGAGENRPAGTAPADSESTQAQNILDKFPEADKQSVMVVASNEDGAELSSDDQAQLKELGGSLGDSVGDESTETVTGPILSDDKQAALLMVPITVGLTNSDTAETVDDLRTAIADDQTAQSLTDDGISLLVTGGPAIGADIASAFNGADFTLLIVTIVIVALLLIITYRSPILWLLPLIVIGTADGLASTVTAAVGDWLDLQFDAGIISVLVFGAGANYALLFISRYREELRRFTDHRVALAEAWTHTASTILASNLTVVLSLLSLVFAIIPGTRGLGITAAVGLLISAAAVLFALPPVLAISGKTMFWPFIPKGEDTADEELTPPRRPSRTMEPHRQVRETVEPHREVRRSPRSGGPSPPAWCANRGSTSAPGSSSSVSWPPVSSDRRSVSTRPRSSGSSPNRRRALTSSPTTSRPGNPNRSGSSPIPTMPMTSLTRSAT